MIFNTTNLIDPLVLSRATRSMLQSVVPAANLDHTAIMAGVSLALADLDVSDPLIVQREIDISALRGQDSATVAVTTRHYGSQVLACYLGDQTEANQIAFDMTDEIHAQLHAPIDEDELHVLINWPRRAAAIPYNDLPAGVESFTPARCVLNGSSGDPFNLLNTDGVDYAAGDRMLACLGTSSTASGNGIYTYTAGTVQRTSDALTPSDFPVGKMIKVLEGILYGDSVWEVIAPQPVIIGTSPINFQQAKHPSNIDTDQANTVIIPRAAAYAAIAITSTLDKATAAQVTAWASVVLGRPIPAIKDATSHRLITATRYAND